MLIIGLIGSACLYAVLYLAYLAADSQLSSSTSTLAVINEMLFVPQTDVFFLLHWLIIITSLYVVADMLLHPARRQIKKSRQRRKDAEYDKTVFRGVKSPKTKDEDPDELAPHY